MKVMTKVFWGVCILICVVIGFTYFFNRNGGLETGANAFIDPINSTFKKVTGGNKNFLPEYKAKDNTGLEDAGAGW
ncbi:TPA: hypothetical protein ACG3P3_001525 [Clostridioides difficile]